MLNYNYCVHTTPTILDGYMCEECNDTIIEQYKFVLQKPNGDCIQYFCSKDCCKKYEQYSEDCAIFTERVT